MQVAKFAQKQCNMVVFEITIVLPLPLPLPLLTSTSTTTITTTIFMSTNLTRISFQIKNRSTLKKPSGAVLSKFVYIRHITTYYQHTNKFTT